MLTFLAAVVTPCLTDKGKKHQNTQCRDHTAQHTSGDSGRDLVSSSLPCLPRKWGLIGLAQSFHYNLIITTFIPGCLESGGKDTVWSGQQGQLSTKHAYALDTADLET